MLNVEFAEALNGSDVFDIAEKVTYKLNLNQEEKEVSEICDAWVKEMAEKQDPNKELAAFVKRTVTDEVYDAPDELLDMIFDRGSVGEFDDIDILKTPENTLEAYEAAKGGTVDRSWIDFVHLKPTWRNRQIETDLSYVDMRKNGFKSVATMTTYGVEALKNALFHDVFSAIDAAITGGEQLINETTAMPTIGSMDALALYLNDRDPQNGITISLTKYCQAIARMPGYAQFMTEKMKEDFNRYGLVKFYDGIRVAGISSAKKLKKTHELLIPDKRIFGCAGQIGTLDMKGDIHVYEDFDNQNEKVKISIKDFTYGYAITHIDNVAKIVMQ